MPFSKAGPPREKIVRRTLADGTVKEYRYRLPPKRDATAAAPKILPGSVDAMLEAWRRSPEWSDLSPRTRENYSIYVRALAPIGRAPVADVKRRHIITLRNAIAAKRGNGAATGFMRATSAAWAWAMDNDLAETNPAHRVKPLKRGTLPAWTEEVLAAALARLDESLRRVVVLAVYTGQRRGDLCALTWSAFDGATIRLRQQKERGPEAGKRELVIPCHRALREELLRWRADRGDAVTILVQPRGKPWTDTHLSRELGKAVKALGLGRFTLHGLRKLAAVRLAQAGCSPHQIAAIGGWRSLSMVQHYTAAADQQDLAQAAVHRLEVAGQKTGRTNGKSLGKTGG
jgi:integrase